MNQKEFDSIINELKQAPEVFQLAIKFYNSMPSGKNKKELGRCISEAKENFRILDVILEDIQWDLEKEEVNKLLDEQNDRPISKD